MPRWASRLTLEVTDVRVERVQDITETDARAEGVTHALFPTDHGLDRWCRYSARVASQRGEPRPTAATAVGGFAALWDHINGARGYGWNLNPWVWAVSFRVLPEAEAASGTADV